MYQPKECEWNQKHNYLLNAVFKAKLLQAGEDALLAFLSLQFTFSEFVSW